ncbi:phage head morphogenesis protein [Rhizobium paknamense]|uniref:SPP1 gp7 family putative phage head morphogenesis protein n=1 Tax=Rhizobium paknamense TaxID=1206817 RepID=A0ABU0I8Z1_9HYPH|nr:phage minor head protein [Rhizobium paknamense]MDQ0454708.1 SPP1 gp7 family putative phage head morphogenesis protein [Rhizobium paknamense]
MTATIAALKPEDAIKALKARGETLAPSFSWQDVYAEEHAQQLTVAKSAGFDILTDLFDGLQTSLAEGKTFRDFASQITPILQAKGWWGVQQVTDPLTGERRKAQLGSTSRLQLIFNANMRVSYAAGHWAAFERNKARRPWLRYVCILDDRTRPEHRKRHNLCLPVDHPYWDTWAPPCGWNCRCTLQSLSDRDVERMRGELKFTPPDDDFVAFTNKRTGEIRMIPRGIDPGWDHNPGKAGYRAFDAAEKLIAAPPVMAAQVNKDPDWLIKPLGDDFARWFDAATAGGRVDRSIVVVGALSDDVLSSLAKGGITPQSGAITLTQQVALHMVRDAKAGAGKAVDMAALRQLPFNLNRPRAVLRDRRDGALLYVFDSGQDPRLAKVVVKIDFADKGRPPGGKAQTIVTNSIRTAGLVETRVLTDKNTYDLMSGTI